MLDFATRFADLALKGGLILAAVMALMVVVERSAFAIGQLRSRALERRYGRLARLAFDGDSAAAETLVAAPGRHHFTIAHLLVDPLYSGADPQHVSRVRSILERTSLRERPG